MARFEAHVTVVRANYRLLTGTLVPLVAEHPDWVTTVAFYTAVHMVEAAFAVDGPGHHSSSHADRTKRLQRSAYAGVWADYWPLLNASRTARYLEIAGRRSTSSFAAHFPPSVVLSRIVNSHLERVRVAAEALIAVAVPGFVFLPTPAPP